ncbi:MAG: response regulator transcription factor [Desulfovibrionaceae bacterium]|nr:response regulator transcription factor [Desulfovibrionaceae bacterium]MBF0514215.1 response regulator transcription factor [Desulfovibrionaceae bacterium]
MSVTIILADDHIILRQGLRALIEARPGLRVVAEAVDGLAAVELCEKLSPSLVIMDVQMPVLNGMEATRKIIAGQPGVKVIALSMHSDRRFVAEMLKNGARGYILKECAFDELTHAIDTVLKGQIYLSPGLTGMVLEDYVQRLTASEQPHGELTNREREVLQLLAEGHPTKQIAGLLHLSEKTVEVHRRNIMKKLGLGNLADLTRYAIRSGLTNL